MNAEVKKLIQELSQKGYTVKLKRNGLTRLKPIVQNRILEILQRGERAVVIFKKKVTVHSMDGFKIRVENAKYGRAALDKKREKAKAGA